MKMKAILEQTANTSRIYFLTQKGKERKDLRFGTPMPIVLDSINYHMHVVTDDQEILPGDQFWSNGKVYRLGITDNIFSFESPRKIIMTSDYNLRCHNYDDISRIEDFDVEIRQLSGDAITKIIREFSRIEADQEIEVAPVFGKRGVCRKCGAVQVLSNATCNYPNNCDGLVDGIVETDDDGKIFIEVAPEQTQTLLLKEVDEGREIVLIDIDGKIETGDVFLRDNTIYTCTGRDGKDVISKPSNPVYCNGSTYFSEDLCDKIFASSEERAHTLPLSSESIMKVADYKISKKTLPSFVKIKTPTYNQRNGWSSLNNEDKLDIEIVDTIAAELLTDFLIKRRSGTEIHAFISGIQATLNKISYT